MFSNNVMTGNLEVIRMKEFELEALAEYDGKDGRPVYIVHQGRVFDVSQSRMWKGGLHMKRHHAGRDLTTDFGGAPTASRCSKGIRRWVWSSSGKLSNSPCRNCLPGS